MTSPQDGGEKTAPASKSRPTGHVPIAGRGTSAFNICPACFEYDGSCMPSLSPCPDCGSERRGLVTVVGTPRAQGSMRAVMIHGHPRVVHSSSKMQAWRDHVREQVARVWEWPPIDGPVRLDRYFVLPAPQNRPGREKPNRELPAIRPDLDKLDRAVWDALTGVCWTDDARIVGGQHWKVYGSPPRLVFYFAPISLEEVLELLPFKPSP